MTLSKTTERVPLNTDENGAVLVSGTRVPLETVVDAFNAGASPEEVALSYPSLHLADVYAVITYYLRHREKVDVYLNEREALAARARERYGVDQASQQIRERLLARKNAT